MYTFTIFVMLFTIYTRPLLVQAQYSKLRTFPGLQQLQACPAYNNISALTEQKTPLLVVVVRLLPWEQSFF
jgi:hypothetical protein